MATTTSIPSNESSEAAPAAARGGAGKWIAIGVALVLVAGAAGGYYLFSRSRTAAAEEKKDGKPEVKAVMHLEGFLVNLADSEENRFLRLGVDLGLEKENEKGEKGGAAASIPLVRDAILNVLTSWKSADLLAADGKAKLKEQLLKELQQKAPELGVAEIYFTDFLVQL
jgi:flagellar basal body-associated protein FliL